MSTENGDRPTNLLLRTHEQIVDDIARLYLDGSRPDSAARDARRFFQSKLDYGQTVEEEDTTPDFAESASAIEAMNSGNMEPAIRALLGSCKTFLDMKEDEMDVIGISLANLANSLRTSPPDIKAQRA